MTKSKMSFKSVKTTPIDDYLSKLPADQRQALQSLRQIVLSIAPNAEEVISYQVPMFKKWKGRDRHVCQKGLLQSAPDESAACQSHG